MKKKYINKKIAHYMKQVPICQIKGAVKKHFTCEASYAKIHYALPATATVWFTFFISLKLSFFLF